MRWLEPSKENALIPLAGHPWRGHRTTCHEIECINACAWEERRRLVTVEIKWCGHRCTSPCAMMNINLTQGVLKNYLGALCKAQRKLLGIHQATIPMFSWFKRFVIPRECILRGFYIHIIHIRYAFSALHACFQFWLCVDTPVELKPCCYLGPSQGFLGRSIRPGVCIGHQNILHAHGILRCSQGLRCAASDTKTHLKWTHCIYIICLSFCLSLCFESLALCSPWQGDQ